MGDTEYLVTNFKDQSERNHNIILQPSGLGEAVEYDSFIQAKG